MAKRWTGGRTCFPGVILYTVLTGYRPFQGDSAVTVSFEVVNRDPIPATLLDTALPPGTRSDHYASYGERSRRALSTRRGDGAGHPAPARSTSAFEQDQGKAAPVRRREATGQTAKEEGRSSALGQLGVAAKPRSSTRGLPLGHGAAENLLQKIRKEFLCQCLGFSRLFHPGTLSHFVWPPEGAIESRGESPLARGGSSQQQIYGGRCRYCREHPF